MGEIGDMGVWTGEKLMDRWWWMDGGWSGGYIDGCFVDVWMVGGWVDGWMDRRCFGGWMDG